MLTDIVASKPDRLTDAEVEAPTPEERWFTPRGGWNASRKSFVAAQRVNGATAAEERPPHYFMPTERDAAPLFDALDAHTIGELRVEVLECENLPNMDSLVLGGMDSLLTGNKTDAYVMLMFEGCAARTSVVFDDLSPRWGASAHGSFRAFRFPVTAPYSVLYVAVNDYDGSQKRSEATVGASSFEVSNRRGIWNSDDPIGRVAIQLGRLASATVYDCWYDLGYSSIEQPCGKRGSVRLRFSLTFKSPRARLLAYLKPPPHTPIIPFNTQAQRTNAIFSKNGEVEAGEYDWDILMLYVEEIKRTIKTLIAGVAAVEDILLWRAGSRLLSAATCVGAQFLISRPNYLPAANCVVALVALASTYGMANEDPRQNEHIHQRVDFFSLCKALVLDRQPPPLVVRAAARPAVAPAAAPAARGATGGASSGGGGGGGGTGRGSGGGGGAAAAASSGNGGGSVSNVSLAVAAGGHLLHARSGGGGGGGEGRATAAAVWSARPRARSRRSGATFATRRARTGARRSSATRRRPTTRRQ